VSGQFTRSAESGEIIRLNAAMRTSRGLAFGFVALVAFSLPTAGFGASASKPAPPPTGKYAARAPGIIKGGSFRIVKHGHKLSLTGFKWTQPTSNTSDGCVAGKFSVKGSLPVSLLKTNGTHHQRVWGVGVHQKTANAGVAPRKVTVTAPDGKQSGEILMHFVQHEPKLKTGQYAFETDGLFNDHDGLCGFSFTPHH
jgi:hypothetical protein